MITLQELRRIGVSNNIDFGVYNVEHLPGTVDDFMQYLSTRLYELAPVDLIDRYIQDYLNIDEETLHTVVRSAIIDTQLQGRLTREHIEDAIRYVYDNSTRTPRSAMEYYEHNMNIVNAADRVAGATPSDPWILDEIGPMSARITNNWAEIPDRRAEYPGVSEETFDIVIDSKWRD